jgi:hypothetical protein
VSSLWSLALLATTLLRLDAAALVNGSDLVVRGTVTRVDSHWTGDHRRIITDVTLNVTETLKGSAGQTVLIEQPGGVVGNIGQRVDGTAPFSVGEEVVVFLEKRPAERYLVTGMAQGKYRIERSSDGKAAFAVPEAIGEATVVDPQTREPVTVRSQALKLEELRTLVRTATKR